MVRVCNENMANAIRILTVEQGTDPRDHALVAFGGAGPTHACEIADALGITQVLVPPAPGLCSAFGALAAAVQDRRRPQRLPHRRAHDPGRGGGHLRGARGAGTRGFHCPGSRGAADRAPPRRHALPGAELRAGGAVPGRHDRRGGTARGLRGVRAPVRGLLRLSAGRDPDRARPAGRDRDGRAARVRAPARDRRAVRGGDTRARRLLPAAGLRADADRAPRRARAGCGARRDPRSSSSWTRPSSFRPDWTLRARKDGILEVAR